MKRLCFLIVFILSFSLALSGCSLISSFSKIVKYDYKNAEDYSDGDFEVKSYIKTIDIDWISGFVLFEYGDVDRITFVEDSPQNIPSDKMMKYLVTDSDVKIKFIKTGFWNIGNYRKNLTVTIPFGTKIDTLKINTVSAKAKIVGIYGGFFDFQSVSGMMQGESMLFDNLNLNTVSGNIDLNSVIIKKLKAKTTSGDINLLMADEAGYNCKFSSTSGMFSSDYSYTKKDGSFIAGNRLVKIDVKTVSGNLKISHIVPQNN